MSAHSFSWTSYARPHLLTFRQSMLCKQRRLFLLLKFTSFCLSFFYPVFCHPIPLYHYDDATQNCPLSSLNFTSVSSLSYFISSRPKPTTSCSTRYFRLYIPSSYCLLMGQRDWRLTAGLVVRRRSLLGCGVVLCGL